MDKNLLREKYKKIRDNLIYDEYIEDIYNNINSLIKILNPKIVGLYMDIKNEIPITFLEKKYQNLDFVYPKIYKNSLKYVKNINYTGKITSLLYNQKEDKEIIPDLIFVPGIVFDHNGYRIGYGKGHFDRYIKSSRKNNNFQKFAGVSCTYLEILHIPFEIHDQKLDFLVNEKIILDFKNA